MYAQKIGYERIVMGVCQTDYSGYPDCREEFIKAAAYAANIGSSSRLFIQTPLMHLTKAETFFMADNLGKLDEVLEYSRTCYNGIEDVKHEWGYGCGQCPACQLRIKGWNEYKKSSK
jgi:7-cyano-7-deazaguanine synthase